MEAKDIGIGMISGIVSGLLVYWLTSFTHYFYFAVYDILVLFLLLVIFVIVMYFVVLRKEFIVPA
ncbi:hypothetical protein HYV49_05650 [Candidatus Pacearchaeota archaeon]|nr:hypothetical protein [Candidatus Pacearchaeota archaeon]